MYRADLKNYRGEVVGHTYSSLDEIRKWANAQIEDLSRVGMIFMGSLELRKERNGSYGHPADKIVKINM